MTHRDQEKRKAREKVSNALHNILPAARGQRNVEQKHETNGQRGVAQPSHDLNPARSKPHASPETPAPVAGKHAHDDEQQHERDDYS